MAGIPLTAGFVGQVGGLHGRAVGRRLAGRASSRDPVERHRGVLLRPSDRADVLRRADRTRASRQRRRGHVLTSATIAVGLAATLVLGVVPGPGARPRRPCWTIPQVTARLRSRSPGQRRRRCRAPQRAARPGRGGALPGTSAAGSRSSPRPSSPDGRGRQAVPPAAGAACGRGGRPPRLRRRRHGGLRRRAHPPRRRSTTTT